MTLILIELEETIHLITHEIKQEVINDRLRMFLRA